jgi:hypothetical protein
LKSRLNNVAWAAIALLSGAWSTGVLSGVSEIATSHEQQRRPSGSAELATAQNTRLDRTSSAIQCWQYGNLIIDESDWHASGNISGSGPILYSSRGRFSKLRLMPFGDTFCIMKSR